MSPNWISLLGGGGRERGDACGPGLLAPGQTFACRLPSSAVSGSRQAVTSRKPARTSSAAGFCSPGISSFLSHPGLPRGREGVSAFRQTPPTPRDPLLTDLSSTRCSCWGWRPMRSLTVVPGLRLQYSWNTSRRLALLCPVCVCGGGPRVSSPDGPCPPRGGLPEAHRYLAWSHRTGTPLAGTCHPPGPGPWAWGSTRWSTAGGEAGGTGA